MVLPFAGDAEIFARVAFLLEAGSRQNRSAGDVARQTGSFEPVQTEPLERKIDNERQSRRHIALPRMGLTDPITETRSFGNAAADIRQPDAADQGLVWREDEETVGLVCPPILGVTGHPRAKARAAQRIRRPARLPRRQEVSRTGSQARPRPVIAPLRRAQKDPVAGQPI